MRVAQINNNSVSFGSFLSKRSELRKQQRNLKLDNRVSEADSFERSLKSEDEIKDSKSSSDYNSKLIEKIVNKAAMYAFLITGTTLLAAGMQECENNKYNVKTEGRSLEEISEEYEVPAVVIEKANEGIDIETADVIVVPEKFVPFQAKLEEFMQDSATEDEELQNSIERTQSAMDFVTNSYDVYKDNNYCYFTNADEETYDGEKKIMFVMDAEEVE